MLPNISIFTYLLWWYMYVWYRSGRSWLLRRRHRTSKQWLSGKRNLLIHIPSISKLILLLSVAICAMLGICRISWPHLLARVVMTTQLAYLCLWSCCLCLLSDASFVPVLFISVTVCQVRRPPYLPKLCRCIVNCAHSLTVVENHLQNLRLCQIPWLMLVGNCVCCF